MSFDQIFVFGDSLSDTGNIYNLTGGALAPFFPTGEYIPGESSNGLSNGPLWIDTLSKSLELNPRPFTELTPDNLMIGDGLNLAIAGANSDDSNYNPDLRLDPSDKNGAGLTEQIQAFDDLTGLVKQQVANPNETLYTLWIGANDYLDYILDSGQGVNATQKVKQTINNISHGLREIIDISTNQLGDENPDIMVFNLPNLTMTPLVQNLSHQQQKTIDKMIDKHNKWLEKEVQKLGRLYDNVNFIYLDMATQFEVIADNILIENSTDAATKTDLYSGTLDFSLTTPGGLNEALDRGESYFFWDSVHPTALVHQLIGNYVIESLNNHWQGQENLFCSEVINIVLVAKN